MVERETIEYIDQDDELRCFEKNGVVCPYCNEKWSELEHDLWECIPRQQDEDTIITCINCNREFKIVCTSIDWWFNSYRLKDDK